MKMNLKRVDQILGQFPKKKILVFGDVGIDKYTYGKVSRISPEAPIPIVEVESEEYKLGLAANVADNIKALSGSPFLVGIVGKDSGADTFASLIGKSKISGKYMISDKSRKTTLKERVVAETQQVCRIDYETSRKIDSVVIREVWEALESALKQVDAVIIEDYAKGLVEISLCRQLIRMADMKGIPVLVDPNLRSSAGLYHGCTMITPNILEAEALSGIKITDRLSLQRAGHRILDEVAAKIVIITRGREGMAVFSKREPEPFLIPTFAREVFDVSGAGDTVIATFALALVSGADIIEAVLLANYAAGVEVGKRGTATVSVAELREYIELIGKLQDRSTKSKSVNKK